jgi:ubiquitin carboxyl-terminal hydrolase 7
MFRIKILKNGYASINVADYLISLQRRVLITFVPRNNYADDFDLILRTDMQYSEIVYRLGKFINCNPLNLRLMTPDIYGNPRSTVHPIEDLTLWDIIQTMPNTGDSWRLFFDVLTMSLSEFEKKKLVKLNICYPKLNQVNYTELIVKKNAQLLDINAELQDKLEVTGQEIRFFTVENHKLKEDLSLNQIVPEDTLIYAEVNLILLSSS